MMYGPQHTWTCPRRCGWYRKYRQHPTWDQRVIYHPIYGPITSAMLVSKDIEEHKCASYLDARDRIMVIRQIRGEPRFYYSDREAA